MNKTVLIAIIGIIAVGAFFYWYGRQGPKTASLPEAQVSNNFVARGAANSNALPPQTNNEGPVEIEVQPLDVSGTSSDWSFRVVLDTHSDELKDNLEEAAELVDDNGNIFRSLSWEGSPPGGHHREGVLVFKAPAPFPKSFSIIMRDIGGVKARTFLWILQ